MGFWEERMANEWGVWEARRANRWEFERRGEWWIDKGVELLL